MDEVSLSYELPVIAGFIAFVIVMLVVDLRVFQRRAHVISIKESLLWASFWIVLSLLINLAIFLWYPSDDRGASALQFFTGYLIELSLSVDNLFVFLLIFSYFAVPAVHQHKVLFWGILGAVVMRLTFIVAGVALISKFHWVLYIFGAFLILTSIRMALQKDRRIDPGRNPVLRLFRRLMPVTDDYEGDKFFIKRAGRTIATPLFVVLLVIETTDVIFATDSVPAVLGITLDPFIVFSSNVCAILGLRALYFALAGIMKMFRYLSYGLVVVLFFIGVKMLVGGVYDMPVGVALGVVATVLLTSVLASIVKSRRENSLPAPSSPLHGDATHGPKGPSGT
jgi:tellurite resistance protein TerC